MSRGRVLLYRSLGMNIGPNCRLENIRIRRPSQIAIGASNALTEGCWLWPIDGYYSGIRIRIGQSNYFNRDCIIDACGQVEIGSHNMFGPGVYVTDSDHSTLPGCWVTDSPMQVGTVVIGNGCWLGARSVILKNVTLGDRCVVAAGAVVTKSFPARSVIAGVPARLLRTLSDE
jgi:acetyltransferase-like isoleucine patch superfamily enzyme